MSSQSLSPLGSLALVGAEVLRARWGWFVGLGLLLVVLGLVAVGHSLLFTVASMVLLGWLLMAAGLAEAVHAFSCQAWGGFFVDLLTGLLYLVAGFLVVSNPAATAVTLTLLIAMFLIFEGLFRIVIAVTVRFPHWGWLLVHGAINLLLGISIWRNWPLSGLWVIGLFVGIDLMMNGWSLVMLGLTAKNLPTAAAKA